jgi:hypothetical protein
MTPIKDVRKNDIIGWEWIENSMIVLNWHIRTWLNSRWVLEKEKLNKNSLDWVLGEIK